MTSGTYIFVPFSIAKTKNSSLSLSLTQFLLSFSFFISLSFLVSVSNSMHPSFSLLISFSLSICFWFSFANFLSIFVSDSHKGIGTVYAMLTNTKNIIMRNTKIGMEYILHGGLFCSRHLCNDDIRCMSHIHCARVSHHGSSQY